MLGGFGVTELIIILAIILVIFGARRLPEIGSGLGKGIKNLKSSLKGEDEIDISPEEEKKEKIDSKKKKDSSD
jgi:sec-independent protein translocase protein TatA